MTLIPSESNSSLITGKQSAQLFLMASSLCYGVFAVMNKSSDLLRPNERNVVDAAMNSFAADIAGLQGVLIGYLKDKESIEQANAAQNGIANRVRTHWDLWKAVFRGYGLQMPDITPPTDTPLPDAAALDKVRWELEEAIKTFSEGRAEIRDARIVGGLFASAIDPLFMNFGLPQLGKFTCMIVDFAEQWESEAKRLRPDYNILNNRSSSQLLAMFAALIHVQPSEMKRWMTPQELAGFVDVALEAKYGFTGSSATENKSMVALAAPEIMSYYIDLDQAAALVNRSKRTLERKLGKMPQPVVRGSGGTKSEWLWSDMAPWLEKEFGKKMPPIPPHAAVRH